MESSYLHTASVSLWSSFALSPLKHTALELFLAAVASLLPYDDSMTWSNTESLPLTSLYIPSQDNEEPHPSIWSARHSPSQCWLWVLRHHNVPLCTSTWISACWGRPRYNFLTPDTSVCLILWSGDSGAWCFFSWLSDFPSVPFILWRVCPPSRLLPPPSLYESLPNTFPSKSVPQCRLVISSFDNLLHSGGSWGS